MAHQSLGSWQILICAIGIFALLSGVYLLGYSGIYHSGDEVAYVNTAIDLIRGRLNGDNPRELPDLVNVLVFARPGDIGPGGEVIGGAGPFTLLLAVVLLLTP